MQDESQDMFSFPNSIKFSDSRPISSQPLFHKVLILIQFSIISKNHNFLLSVPLCECSGSSMVRVANSSARAKTDCASLVSFVECLSTPEFPVLFYSGSIDLKDSLYLGHAGIVSPTRALAPVQLEKSQCGIFERIPTEFVVREDTGVMRARYGRARAAEFAQVTFCVHIFGTRPKHLPPLLCLFIDREVSVQLQNGASLLQAVLKTGIRQSGCKKDLP